MPELGASEDPAALIPGDPVVLRTAGATYRRYALTLEDASTGLGRVGTPEGWSGPAADGFRAAFAPEPRRWQDAATAFGDAARATDDHAAALEWARGRAAEAVIRWREAQMASATARAQYDRAIANGAAPVPFLDPGDGARADAQRLLAQARQHVRDSGDRSAAVVTAACAAAPAAPGFWSELADGAGAVAAEAGNALASVGNALLRNPLDVAAVVGGGALAAVSAAGVVGSVALDATGIGAVAGVPWADCRSPGWRRAWASPASARRTRSPTPSATTASRPSRSPRTPTRGTTYLWHPRSASRPWANPVGIPTSVSYRTNRPCGNCTKSWPRAVPH